MSSQTDPRSQLAQQIAAAVQTRLGRSDPEILAAIEQEVDLALGDKPPDLGLLEVTHERQASSGERIVVTSTGRNQSGIVARLAKVIDEFNGDIRDLSQTIVGDYFTMIFVVDISGATSEGARFVQLRERLQETARDLGIHVVAIHDDILSSMHAV
jgi:ACT domain-containing protein